MNEPFIIPVCYQGTEHEFKARLERWGCSYRIAVLIGDNTFVFEPNEEGGYRAITFGLLANVSADTGLMQAIAEKLMMLSK